MGLPMSCVDHHGRSLTMLRRQPRYDPSEDAPVAPTLPAIESALSGPYSLGTSSHYKRLEISEENSA